MKHKIKIKLRGKMKDKIKTNILGQLDLRATFEPSTLDVEKRTVDLVWTTGARVKRYAWEGSYFEELEVSETAVILKRLNSGAPFLNSHNNYDLKNVLGVVERAWIENGIGKATVRFSSREDVQSIFKDVQDGVLRNVSVGYAVHRYQDVSGENDKIKTYRAVSWEPMEISLVSIPADADSQIRKNEEKFEVEIIEKQNNEMISLVEREEQMPIAENTIQPNVEEAIEQGKKLEKERCESIRLAVRAANLDESFSDKLISEDVKIEKARELVIEELAKRQAKINNTPAIEINPVVSQDQFRGAVETAIMHRSGIQGVELTDHAKQFRGYSLARISEEILKRNNVNVYGMTESQIVQRAMTTSDLPIILGNVANKSLSEGYQIQGQTFWAFTKKGKFKDFKEKTIAQFGDYPSIEKLTEKGEYKEGYIGEKSEKYKAARFGRLVVMTKEMIVNDDLDMLSKTPKMMGAAAARKESQIVYEILTSNPTMADGNALFHASHGNLGSAAGITETSLDAGVKAMMLQKSVDGKDSLNIMPKFLVCGANKRTEALKILAASTATKSGDVNVFQNTMTPIIDGLIDNNKWFLIMDPLLGETIELGYIDGEEGPQISSFVDQRSDNLILKVSHAFGAKAIDWRGMYYNPGA